MKMNKQDIINEILEIIEIASDDETLNRLTVADLKIVRLKLAVFVEDVLCRQRYTKAEREEMER
jgi:hypothetical protein